MKKTIIIICSIVLIISGGILIKIIYDSNIYNKNKLSPDQTNNINVMLKRPSGWKKLIDQEVITENDMAIIDGSTATIPITAELLRQFYSYSDDTVNASRFVFHSTTHNAYENLIFNQTRFPEENLPNVSLIFVTQPSTEEIELAKSNNVTLDITPVAKDGFVFITHKDNPVDSLTIEQIQKIYTGEITNWQQVGGESLDIKAFQREPNSGSQTAMEEMVMKGKTMMTPIKANVYEGMGGLVDAVAEYKNGKASIGYTYYYYIKNLYKNDNIKVLKVSGITPENENLTSGAYAFSTNYYAVIRKGELKDSPAVKLRDFLISRKGQDIIEMAGYCRRSEGNE